MIQTYSYEVRANYITELKGDWEECDKTQRTAELPRMFNFTRRPLESEMEYISNSVRLRSSSVILFSSITTPLRAAFYDEDDLLWVMVETFTDIVFLLDIIFTFMSAYYNKIEMLISSRREIVCDYLKTWFVVDLISALPLSLIFRSNANDLGKLAKIPRIYRIIKTTK